MNEKKIIYDFVVGYMLKVIKSGTKISKFQKEFDAIKHGDYVCFINLIGVGIAKDITFYQEGTIIPSENQMDSKNVDLLFLMLSSISFIKFYEKCYQEYGEIIDTELTDIDFENLANFEMILRMFYNNIFVNEGRMTLFDIIIILFTEKNIPINEIEIVQKGRDFLNMVKGHKAKFSSIKEGLITFSEALAILKKYKITIKI